MLIWNVHFDRYYKNDGQIVLNWHRLLELICFPPHLFSSSRAIIPLKGQGQRVALALIMLLKLLAMKGKSFFFGVFKTKFNHCNSIVFRMQLYCEGKKVKKRAAFYLVVALIILLCKCLIKFFTFLKRSNDSGWTWKMC